MMEMAKRGEIGMWVTMISITMLFALLFGSGGAYERFGTMIGAILFFALFGYIYTKTFKRDKTTFIRHAWRGVPVSIVLSIALTIIAVVMI